MKNFFLKLMSTFLAAALFLISCQKEVKTNSTDHEQLAAKNDKPKNECRLTAINGPGVNYGFLYNERGLNSEWNIPGFGTFKQEYNAAGQLKKSRWFVGGELFVTIVFTYDAHGRAIRDTWYYGNTNDVYDDVFYTRNASGLITKVESFVGDYYTDAVFTPEGNTHEWHFYVGSTRIYSGFLHYRETYRNPYLAIPGIEYGFPFLNPFYLQQRWLIASEKVVGYDENNSPVIFYDYDPDKTIIQPGFQHYPASADFFDMQNNWWDRFSYEYENCGPGNEARTSGQSLQNDSNVHKGTGGFSALLMRNPKLSVKEQFRRIKEQMKTGKK